jgi:GT2 family glycosyltransferase
LELPNGVQVRVENCYGLKVADAYNKLFQTALDARSDYVLTVEDDTFPQSDALIKLLELVKKNPKCVVGAWYPKKEESLQGVHIILKDGKRQQMDCDGTIQEAYTISMGCTLYPIEIFKTIAYPWFVTTNALTQDSFFSQLAREAGYKLLVDTSIKCKHIDRKTGKVFI